MQIVKRLDYRLSDTDNKVTRILILSRIFVVLVKFLEDHVCDEGLFRKAGSVSRQRVLRVSPLCVMRGCSGRQGLSADRGCSGWVHCV